LNAPRVVAAFDFDGTLTRRDTLIPFLARSLGWPGFLLALLKSSPWLAGYALRLVPNDVAKARLLSYALAGRSIAEVDAWAACWLAHDLPHQLQAWTMARLQQHQRAGHCCVMVSASPDVYLAGAARHLGFDGLVCTQLEVLDGRLSGKMQTPNCHGEQKVLRLNAWLTERFGAAAATKLTLHAYGDSKGDKPMLRMARHAWYRGKPWKP
jgi:phosphatidylglycerophosphatase C